MILIHDGHEVLPGMMIKIIIIQNIKISLRTSNTTNT
jgi:hypothetical protein